ncbi:hypothetical protein [Polyangium sorediatum]|uniref:Lipoprotein n=1 Tax=Polyangium sorediatum TaxID=889274 RepID=A0ABT6NTA4_9BACT|nr:hypothetical protein [Polyangium sorediatum]MDI1431375.1 hypothetical protein [Polyangium sorediatum]
MANPLGPTPPARVLAPSLLVALFACSGSPRPAPAERPAPKPDPKAEAPSAAPKGGSLLDDDELPALPLDLSAGVISAFAGRFEPVVLPPKTPTIVDAAGRDERDVWMLAGDGRVFWWDGARLADRGAPRCFTDSCCGTLVDCAKQPAMCSKQAVERCQPFGPSCALPVTTWSSIRVTPDDVIVRAFVETGGMRASMVESRLGKKGRWSCEQGSEDLVYPGSAGRGDGPGARELTVDGASLRLEGPAVLVNRYGGTLLLIDGRRVPLPEDVHQGYSAGAEIAARSPGDLWLWTYDGFVWRGNGLAWTPWPSGLTSMNELWVDPNDGVWALGAVEENQEELLRWDPDKGSGQRFETPGATSVRSDGRGFWLWGLKALYHWDGAALRRAAPPLAIKNVWRGPSGELWAVGSDRSVVLRKATDSDEEDVYAGAVFRVSGGQKP